VTSALYTEAFENCAYVIWYLVINNINSCSYKFITIYSYDLGKWHLKDKTWNRNTLFGISDINSIGSYHPQCTARIPSTFIEHSVYEYILSIYVNILTEGMSAQLYVWNVWKICRPVILFFSPHLFLTFWRELIYSTFLFSSTWFCFVKCTLNFFFLFTGPRATALNVDECPLHVKHPATGEEFALGCGVCRNAHTFWGRPFVKHHNNNIIIKHHVKYDVVQKTSVH
jgi:hypothetical protein